MSEKKAIFAGEYNRLDFRNHARENDKLSGFHYKLREDMRTRLPWMFGEDGRTSWCVCDIYSGYTDKESHMAERGQILEFVREIGEDWLGLDGSNLDGFIENAIPSWAFKERVDGCWHATDLEYGVLRAAIIAEMADLMWKSW